MLDYLPQRISSALIRKVSKWPPPNKPMEIYDKQSHLVLRHQPSGYLSLYIQLGRGKRERICNARDILDSSNPLTFAQARKGSEQLRGLSAGGRDFGAERKRERQIPTFREFLEHDYAPWILREKRGGASTARHLGRFLPAFGNLRLNKISKRRLLAWIAVREKKQIGDHKISTETVNTDITVLRACLARAADTFEILDQSPLKGFKLRKVDTKRKVIRPFTEPEEEKLRAELEGREGRIRRRRASANEWRRVRHYPELDSLDGEFADLLRPAVIVSLGTGLRRGELIGLRWAEVDFDDGLVHVRGETAKDFETRETPMNFEVRTTLLSWRMQNGRPADSRYVFEGPKGKLFTLQKGYYKLLEDAGIKRVDARGRRLVWHSLRHTFGTRLAQSGVDIETVRQLMGHSNIATTARYFDSTKERKQAAVDALVTEVGSR